jgi:hypothetical protein
MKKDKPGVIHAANAEKSKRLRKTYYALRYYGNPTTKQIADHTDSCAVHTDIAELRANGYQIDCKCVGRGRFEYRLR